MGGDATSIHGWMEFGVDEMSRNAHDHPGLDSGLTVSPIRLVRYRRWKRTRAWGPLRFVGLFALLVSSLATAATWVPTVVEAGVRSVVWPVMQTFIVYCICSALLGTTIWLATERHYRDLREAETRLGRPLQ